MSIVATVSHLAFSIPKATGKDCRPSALRGREREDKREIRRLQWGGICNGIGEREQQVEVE
jgi:hypothetical protein